MEAKIYSHEYWTCQTNPKFLFENYRQKLVDAGFKILEHIEHHFEPIGYTALFLLTERNKTYLQLSSCNKQFFDNFLKLGNL